MSVELIKVLRNAFTKIFFPVINVALTHWTCPVAVAGSVSCLFIAGTIICIPIAGKLELLDNVFRGGWHKFSFYCYYYFSVPASAATLNATLIANVAIDIAWWDADFGCLPPLVAFVAFDALAAVEARLADVILFDLGALQHK